MTERQTIPGKRKKHNLPVGC